MSIFKDLLALPWPKRAMRTYVSGYLKLKGLRASWSSCFITSSPFGIEDISTKPEEELPSIDLIVLQTSSVGKTIYKAYTTLSIHRRP